MANPFLWNLPWTLRILRSARRQSNVLMVVLVLFPNLTTSCANVPVRALWSTLIEDPAKICAIRTETILADKMPVAKWPVDGPNAAVILDPSSIMKTVSKDVMESLVRYWYGLGCSRLIAKGKRKY
jgi:hypothetical protein